jgi:hypothetical protein
MASDLGSCSIDLNFNWRENQYQSPNTLNQLKSFVQNEKKIQCNVQSHQVRNEINAETLQKVM